MKKIIWVGLFIVGILLLINTWHSQNNQALHCKDLFDIEVIPFKNEHVNDNTYNAFLQNKKQSIPCLIDSITDTRKMHDPRQAPPYAGFVVGDTAFFVLLHIIQKPLESFLPKEIQKRFDKQGVYAYFKYVEKDTNRQALQNILRSNSKLWLQKME